MSINKNFKGSLDKADDAEFTSVDTEEATIAVNNTGFSGRVGERALVSDQDRTITVGTDTDTIQEAVNQIPLLLRHRWKISVPDGTYDENVLIPPFTVADTAGEEGSNQEGASQLPIIEGNKTTPTNVTVNSITITGTQGSIAPRIDGFNPVNAIPDADESAAVAAFGCKDVSFRHLDFSGATTSEGILVYASNAKIRGSTHFGSGDLDYGVRLKHQAHVSIDDWEGQVTGSVNNQLINDEQGSVISYKNLGTDSSVREYRQGAEGFILNEDFRERRPLPAAEMRLSADQTIPTGTKTPVEFDATPYDRESDWDDTNYEFGIFNDGIYRVSAQVQFLGPSDATSLTVRIDKGDNTILGVVQKNGSIGSNPVLNVSTAADLRENDAIQVRVEHDEGSDLDINDSPWSQMHVEKIG